MARKHVPLLHDLIHANIFPWQEERRCSLSRGSHTAPKFSVVVCHHCHSSRCYKHILSVWHVHSAQALKAHLADTSSTLWHQLHKDMKAEYTKDYPQLKAKIGSGSGYTLTHRLSYYASRFAPTAPLNQAVSLGFYDTPGTETNVVLPLVPLFTDVFAHPLASCRCIEQHHFVVPGRRLRRSHQSPRERKVNTDHKIGGVQVSGPSPPSPRDPIHENGDEVHQRRTPLRENALALRQAMRGQGRWHPGNRARVYQARKLNHY